MLMAGLSALSEQDMKKIVALSTLRQLGLIIISLGAGLTQGGFFHLISHAFFKALLFLTVGAIIHRARDYQDTRKASILPARLPLTLAFSLRANLSLCGMPFMRGFYSKDYVIERMGRQVNRMLVIGILYLATALTAAYTARFVSLLLLTGETSLRIN